MDYDYIRIVKGVYPTRLTMEFKLLDADGKVVSEGTRRLQHTGYWMTSALPANDPLRYDKEMINDWIRREFKRPSWAEAPAPCLRCRIGRRLFF
jgi:hypothetical protein